MLQQSAYQNPAPGVWNVFDAARPHLERQELEPGFADGTGLAPEALSERFWALADELAAESPILRKARLFAFLLDNGRIAIDPDDWFGDKLDHQNLMRKYNRKALKAVEQGPLQEARETLDTAHETGWYGAELDLGHTSPGWRFLYEQGLRGILAKADAARAAHGGALSGDQADFYDALHIVYEAICRFTARLSEYAASLMGESPARDARLAAMADSLAAVPGEAPKDLHEALQFSFIMHQMIEMEGENVRSMAGFDRCFGKYYDADVASGRLTRERAQELIEYFFTKFFAHTRGVDNGKNFYFGGQYADGSNAENELTYAALEAYARLKTTDPKLSVRFFEGSTDRMWDVVTRTIRAGQTSFVLINDETAINGILTQGKTPEEAREFLLIGCYEPAIEGREIACNMSIKINLAKCVELALFRGRDPASGRQLGPDTGDPEGFAAYEDFEAAFFRQMEAQIDSATEAIKAYELYWPQINPSPVLAGSFVDALEKGRDIGQCGPKYNNTGSMGGALANAADSLIALKRAVYEQSTCTMAEMLAALRDDFEGHTRLHLHLLNRVPKWCNADPEVDAIARRIAGRYGAEVNRRPNNRGGRFVPSMFTLNHRFHQGHRTGALPDGRKKGVYLALNIGANTGMDREGVTAQLLSLTELDYTKIPNGSVADVYLHPSAVAGEEGLLALQTLIKTYFARGGFGIQFNIFDTATLRDAQKHPEKYATLQIRVCGWNVYFVSLSGEEQEQYILMNTHTL